MLPLGPRPGSRLAFWLGLTAAAPVSLFRRYCWLRGLLQAAMLLYLAAGVCWIGRLAYRLSVIGGGGEPPGWSWMLALGLMSLALLLSGIAWLWGRRLRRELLRSWGAEGKHGVD